MVDVLMCRANIFYVAFLLLCFSNIIHALPFVTECIEANGFVVNFDGNTGYKSTPISFIEGVNYPQIRSDNPSQQDRIVYGSDVDTSKCVYMTGHTETLLNLMDKIADNPTYIFTLDHKEPKKNSCHIINMSCGIIDDNRLLDQDTIAYIRDIFQNFYGELGTVLDGFKQDGQVDEYFIYKYRSLMKSIHANFKSTNNRNTNEYIARLKEDILQSFKKEKNHLSGLLSGDYLVVQSLANGEQGHIVDGTCSFDISDVSSSNRNNLIYARNFYYLNGEFIVPQSQTPGDLYADRTLCAVTPAPEVVFSVDNPVEYCDVSTNSDAAPFISIASGIIEQRLLAKGKQLNPEQIAESLLMTATPHFLKDRSDEVFVYGRKYSTVFGAGIMNAEKAIKYALEKFSDN
jgi:hypothetical protein